jgi:hypothetical protein
MESKRFLDLDAGSTYVDGIIQLISQHANKLIQRWGQENAPPPAHVYSLEGREGPGLRVIQKTFQGDFEVQNFNSI